MDDASGHAPEKKRTAIVFVHGQGQQRPMDDVRELARTVWCGDPKRWKDGSPPKVWTVPDARLGMADLGRVTTEAGKHGLRVDFFELYWAHFMEDNRLKHFLAWFRMLQDRPRREAPHGLLAVRQWTIRFFESITLLSMLFAYVVAMLLPPLSDGLTADQLSAAFFNLPVPTSADISFVLAGFTGAAIVASWLSIIVNEVQGGASPKEKKASLWSLRAKAHSSRFAVAGGIVAALAIIVVIVHLFIWQGPLLQWGDVRLPILVATTIAAMALLFRRMEIAALIAVPTATAALLCALAGGVSETNLWNFGDTSNMLWGTLVENSEPRLIQIGIVTAYAYFALYMFAGLWSFVGLNSHVGAARRWWWRLLWTALIVALSVGGAIWTLTYLYPLPDVQQPGVIPDVAAIQASGAQHPLVWGVYSSGVTIVVTLFIGFILSRIASDAFLTPVMTDSARYFSRDPQHVVARQRIREAGVKLLDRLHDPLSGYERIIVVAHSLGTAVAYELLSDYWARQSGAYIMQEGDAAHRALMDVENATHALNAAVTQGERDAARRAFRIAQRGYAEALAAMEVAAPNHGHLQSREWLITDFITLGSPLTHASLLMADSRKDLWVKQRERTLAACPPITFAEGEVDLAQGKLTFSGFDGQLRPLHSALFAAVRWTNHFFKTGDWIVQGDVIGGPIGPPVTRNPKVPLPPEEVCGGLGRGVLDREVERSATGKLFAHNEYWRSDLGTESLAAHMKESKPQHIAALIEALDLEDRERARTTV